MPALRTILAVPLLALAAAPLLAQKPGAGEDPVREHWRDQGLALCVAELNPLEGLAADDSEAICGCAVDRFLADSPSGALPPLDGGRLRGALGGRVFACTIEQAPARAGAVTRWLAERPPAGAPPPVALVPLTPIEGGEPSKPPAPDEAPGASGPDLGAWLNGLSLPHWLSGRGLPLWAWVPIVLFVFLFLRGLLRGGDSREDLMGPPRSMRPGGPAPRPPGLPPRG